jgi:uncharacterized membrane protein YhaH (DUF805 family)
MNFGEAIKSGFNNYANFQGRSQRSGYWYWFLFTNIVGFGAQVISGGRDNFFGSTISSLIVIALILPSIAYGVRRLHDIDKSGWFLLFALIPLVGWIFLLAWHVKDSELGTNRFGANPKGA